MFQSPTRLPGSRMLPVLEAEAQPRCPARTLSRALLLGTGSKESLPTPGLCLIVRAQVQHRKMPGESWHPHPLPSATVQASRPETH